MRFRASRETRPRASISTPEQYRQWFEAHKSATPKPRPKIDLPYEFYANIHDAWRSTRMDSKDDALSRTLYSDLNPADSVQCWITGDRAILATYQFAKYDWPQRNLDNGFMYHSMWSLYQRFEMARSGRRDSEPTFLKTLGQIATRDSLTDNYAGRPEGYKEVDRRIMVVAVAKLADETCVQWQSLPNGTRRSLLRDENVQHAIADGNAVLAAARGSVTYDPTQGFATEVTRWQV